MNNAATGGGAGGISDSSYIDFNDTVQKNLDDIKAKIVEALNWVIDKWNDTVGGFAKSLIPGYELLVAYAKHKLDNAFEAIWNAFDAMVKEVWDQVRRVFATPGGLMTLSESYQSAADELKPETILISRTKQYLADGWSGDAFNSYASAADEQRDAVTAVADALTTASGLCAAGAKQIYDTWHSVINFQLTAASTVVGAIEEATDAGKVVTLDVGPIEKLLGQLALDVLGEADDLATFWTDNQTTGKNAWTQLTSNIGLADDNHWPNISGYDRGNMHDKGEWDHS